MEEDANDAESVSWPGMGPIRRVLVGGPLVAITAMTGSEASQLCGRWMLEERLLHQLNWGGTGGYLRG